MLANDEVAALLDIVRSLRDHGRRVVQVSIGDGSLEQVVSAVEAATRSAQTAAERAAPPINKIRPGSRPRLSQRGSRGLRDARPGGVVPGPGARGDGIMVRGGRGPRSRSSPPTTRSTAASSFTWLLSVPRRISFTCAAVRFG